MCTTVPEISLLVQGSKFLCALQLCRAQISLPGLEKISVRRGGELQDLINQGSFWQVVGS